MPLKVDQIVSICEILQESGDKLKALSQPERLLCKAAIKIRDNSASREASIFYHTCFNLVDFPMNKIATEKEFVSLLEASLSGSKYNRA